MKFLFFRGTLYLNRSILVCHCARSRFKIKRQQFRFYIVLFKDFKKLYDTLLVEDYKLYSIKKGPQK